MSRILVRAISIFLLLVSFALCFGQSQKYLDDLEGYKQVVLDFNATWLTPSQLLTIRVPVENELLRNGIKIMPSIEASTPNVIRTVYLYVEIERFEAVPGYTSYGFKISGRQITKSPFPKHRAVFTIVWENAICVGTVATDLLASGLAVSVPQRMAFFCNDWLKANPK